MAILNIFCVIEGQTTPFLVEIESTKTVSHLKDFIWAKIPEFKDIAAHHLTLWRVSIPAGGLTTLLDTLQDKNELLDSLPDKNKTKLDPFAKISKVFGAELPEYTIHIFVQPPQSGLSEEDVLRMTLPDIVFEHRADRQPSRTATRSVTRRTPTGVAYWNEFVNGARAYEPSRQRKHSVNDFRFNQQCMYSNESTLTSIYDMNILKTIYQLYGNDVKYGCPGSVVMVAEPDRVLYGEGDSLLLLIEVKTPAKVTTEDLVATYNHDIQSDPASSTVHYIEQIFGYLSANSRKYGVVTTYNDTWFMKRQGSEVFISSVIKRGHEDPTLIRCYAYLLNLAKDDAFEAPAPPLPQSSSPHSDSVYEEDNDSGDTDYVPSRWGKRRILSTGFSVDIKNVQLSEFEFQDLLGQGRSGNVFRARWRGETVAVKVCDLYQHPELEVEMLTEVAVYDTLSSLQGTFVPQLKLAGFYGRLFVAATEIAGEPLDLTKLSNLQRLRVVDALSHIHELNVIHGDIKADNILALVFQLNTAIE
ncbi:hypothetical protein BGZ65_002801 [Modicella reniformis]|uniref:Protein kinase domain-containing protein n=1 Tax=Modicella reniformis TaxID=1440133 RepID=A0A9P6M9J0_9FUNG|nr:hypothetical protein BGZ65_002801 [Modicella reniformis]